MSDPCIVLIGAADVLPLLKEAADTASGEVLTFTDADALRALEVITKRKPAIVAVERVFAGTPRGAALINRIKCDPSLLGSEIRVVSHNDAHLWAGPRRSAEAAGGNGTAVVASAHAATSMLPLDQRGTRRAPRFRLTGEMAVLVDGNQAVLVDLSTLGAQLVSTTVLKPGQRVRMALFDARGPSVSSRPWRGPRSRSRRTAFRATAPGIEFIDADATAVDAYCSGHKR